MRLRRAKDLWEYTIAAADADIGKVHDFYFDDETWTIRYIVVDTGVFLSGRKVLVPLSALREQAWSPLHIRVKLTWNQIETSPSIDFHEPISRQHELEQHRHYGTQPYWGEGTAAGAPNKPSADAHLRSIREVTGYHVSAIGGEIGHVEDFLFDDAEWGIRYAIIDTKKWWSGQRVLLSPQWIKRVNWADRMIYVELSREMVRKSPKWDPEQPLSRKYELELHKHYNYAPYWTPMKQEND